MTSQDQATCGNYLLRRLTAADFALLAQRLKRIELESKHLLSAANQPIEQIYFLEGGIASVVTAMPDTAQTEVGIFGREGVSGTSILLGSDRSPHDTFMQVDGTTALTIGAGYFLDAVQSSPSLRDLMLRFVQTFLVQAATTAASNAHHRVDARLARWLLMCHDRLDGDDVHLTHEFMATMIAAQRTRVTLTLHILEGAGMIQSRRGRVTITDRAKMLELAGDAYGQPEAEYRRLIGPLGR